MRSTLSPAFTGHKMRLMYDFVANVGKQTVLTLKQQIDDGREKDFEFKELATKFTVDNIASCAFGIEVNSFSNPDNDFHRIAKELTDFQSVKTLVKFMGMLLVPWVMKFLKISFFGAKVSKFFEEAIVDTMKVREKNGIVRHDMIHLLMQAKKGVLVHEAEEKGSAVEGFATVEESQMGKTQVKRKWEDIDLAAQCFIFFFAGFDTVATTMGFMGYELACNPEIQQKLYEEIAEAERAQEGKPLTYEKLQGLMYLDQVICEVLRKWPPAPGTDRICVKDYDLEFDDKKITIEKDINFMIPIWGIHR
jgi:cytochrome P450 family 9